MEGRQNELPQLFATSSSEISLMQRKNDNTKALLVIISVTDEARALKKYVRSGNNFFVL